MKKLVILRGISGCGKSTFVKEHHLENYTLCPDNIRLLLSGPVLMSNGNFQISQEKGSKVFSILYELLEARMEEGEFTIIDSTNLTKDDFIKYKKLAKKYRYRLYCIDFSDVPYETIMKRNKLRDEYKIVPEYVLEKMRDRLLNSTIPNGITILKPSEFEKVLVHPIDLSQYKKIHHFGDIHGCYTVLKEYFDKTGGIKEDNFYIFCGDYIDRGIENTEVLNFLFSIKDLPNVQFIQGNHEAHLIKYMHSEKSKSLEFNDVTAKEFDRKNLSKKELSMFCKKLTQCSYYTYHEKTVLATHGGLSTIPENLAYISTTQMIKGVGRYSEYSDVAKTFYETTDKNTYQVNGHRNVLQLPIEIEEDGTKLRCFNLEGGVEQGRCLRVLTLDENGFTPIELKNNIYKQQENQFLFDLRHNNLIKEKKFDEISSFNFSRDAFKKKIWNDQTIKARGLYLNNKTGKVVARGYEKFFTIDERSDSTIGYIKNNWKFPITCYVKENGYLGLVSYREKTNELFVTTKSDPTGKYSEWFKDLLSTYDIKKIKEYIKEHNCSFLLEVIDIKHDSHIIKYHKSKLVLLDIVENNIETFNRKSYEELCEIAREFKFEVKKKAITLNTFEEFISWYKDSSSKNYKYNNEYIEGFVFEDTENRMCKLKTYYYKYWKYLRGRVENIIEKNLDFEDVKCNINIMDYDKMNKFLKWFCTHKNEINTDKIIEIREIYEK